MAKRGRPRKVVYETFEQTQDAVRRKAASGDRLTYDELRYVIDVDDKGTKPSAKKMMSKMGIMKIERRALGKLKKALAAKGIKSFNSVFG